MSESIKNGPFTEWLGNHPQLDGWGPVGSTYKSIFVHIPKTAGITIALSLNMACKQCHNPARDIQQILYKSEFGEKVWLDYFKFSFVRNPWSWVISNICFHANWFKVEVDPFKFLIQWMEHGQIVIKDKFTERMSFMSRKSQCDFLYEKESKGGKLLVDFVGKFENLQQDFDYVCSQIGAPMRKLPHKNQTKKYRHYTEYYNEDTKQFIATKFAKDIEYFGYEFER